MQDLQHFQLVFAYVVQLKKPLKYSSIKISIKFIYHSPKLAVYDETRIKVKNAHKQLIIRVDGAVGFKSEPKLLKIPMKFQKKKFFFVKIN
jgi:hypothetical protein